MAVRRGLGRRAFRLEVLSCEGAFCGGHGYLDATHAGCLLGEAATGTRLSLRVALPTTQSPSARTMSSSGAPCCGRRPAHHR